LRHEHLVPIYDVGQTEEHQPYLVSQLIEGTTLADRIRGERLSFQESAQLITQLGDGLHHAHSKRIVHRDIKPANILLDSQMKPYLTDFGLALREGGFGEPIRQGGTIAYMSPEQARGEGHLVDGRSDIFSLGAVFYELLTGQRPFVGANRKKVLEQLCSGEARPPRMLDGTIPRELERICLKALSPRRFDRYSTARDLADDIRSWQLNSHDSGDSAAAANIPTAIARPPKVVPKGLRAFDENDADFFLPLIPGPRARGDVPQSIHFWKTRIEHSDPTGR
jgi:serine/threonine protein kinase